MEMISIEIAYALPHAQYLLQQQVRQGTTAQEAVSLCEFPSHLQPDRLLECKMGLYGQVFGRGGLEKVTDYVLKDGDRVEIYRPLKK